MVWGLGGALGHSELPLSSAWCLQPRESFEAHPGPSTKGRRLELGIVRGSWMPMCMCLSVGQGAGGRDEAGSDAAVRAIGVSRGELCLAG